MAQNALELLERALNAREYHGRGFRATLSTLLGAALFIIGAAVFFALLIGAVTAVGVTLHWLAGG